jgi:hypothetical protein
MVKFRIYRSKEETPIVKYKCSCGTVNVRGIFRKDFDFTPFICYKCFLILPSIVNMFNDINIRTDYYVSGIVPKHVRKNGDKCLR